MHNLPLPHLDSTLEYFYVIGMQTKQHESKRQDTDIYQTPSAAIKWGIKP